MAKKDAAAESKPTTTEDKHVKKEEMSPELKAGLKKLQDEYDAKCNARANKPVFPTRMSSKMEGGTKIMAGCMVLYMAAIAHLFQEGRCFMMTTNAKFGSDKISQYFAAHHFLMAGFVIVTNLKLPMNICNFLFLGLSIGLNAFVYMNEASMFNDLGFYGFVALQVVMLILTVVGYYRTASLVNAILFFTGLVMFSTMWGQPLIAYNLSLLQREFLGWFFCGLFFFTATNMGCGTTIANFVTLIFWVGIDLVVVEDNKFWKTETSWRSSLWILGFHGVVGAIHQLCMFREAAAYNGMKMKERMEYSQKAKALQLKLSSTKSKDL